MHTRLFLLFVVSGLAVACGGTSPHASHAQASAPKAQTRTISYFVRAQGREDLLGTLTTEGTVVRNPAIATADDEEDAESLARMLSVRLDADGRPLPGPAAAPDQPAFVWSLGDDGALACTVTPPAGVELRPIVIERGFRVLPDGRAVLPELEVSYVLRDDGTIVQRFPDGREALEPRWRVEGASGTNKRRAMIGLVILDDFFDTGGRTK